MDYDNRDKAEKKIDLLSFKEKSRGFNCEFAWEIKERNEISFEFVMKGNKEVRMARGET